MIDQNLILQQDAIDQTRANLEGAEAERTRASLDLTRYTHLVRDSWATHQRFETATADAEKANASVAAAKAALASARQQKEVLLAQHKDAEAKLDQAVAMLQGARADLDKAVTKAPIDGAILKVNVRLGEYASAGVLSSPLMTMGSIDPLHLRVDIDEADAWRVRPESPAIARLRGNSETHLCPLRTLGAAQAVADRRHDRACGYEGPAGVMGAKLVAVRFYDSQNLTSRIHSGNGPARKPG